MKNLQKGFATPLFLVLAVVLLMLGIYGYRYVVSEGAFRSTVGNPEQIFGGYTQPSDVSTGAIVASITSPLAITARTPTTISGTASPVGSAIDVVVGDKARYDATTVQPNGTWSVNFKRGFPAGAYPITVFSHTPRGMDNGTVLATGTLIIAAAQ